MYPILIELGQFKLYTYASGSYRVTAENGVGCTVTH